MANIFVRICGYSSPTFRSIAFSQADITYSLTTEFAVCVGVDDGTGCGTTVANVAGVEEGMGILKTWLRGCVLRRGCL